MVKVLLLIQPMMLTASSPDGQGEAGFRRGMERDGIGGLSAVAFFAQAQALLGAFLKFVGFLGIACFSFNRT